MVEIGDRVVIESEKVGTPPRTGVVAEVLGQLIKVQWEDGHESTLMPSAGALRVVGHSAPA